MNNPTTLLSEVYAPVRDNEILVSRKQTCKYTSSEHQNIYKTTDFSREDYLEAITKKVVGIGYTNKTIIVFYKKDKPGTLFVKFFNTSVIHFISRKNIFTKRKTIHTETISFSMINNNIIFRTYEKSGKKSGIFFSLNLFSCYGFNDAIKSLYIGDEFFDILCYELNINGDWFKSNHNLLDNDNKLKAMSTYFLLYKREFNFKSLGSNVTNLNFNVNSLQWCLNKIKPGYGVTEVFDSLFPGYNNIDLLLNHTNFSGINQKETCFEFKSFMDLFNVTPLDLVSTNLDRYKIAQIFPLMKILKRMGYQFDDFRNGLINYNDDFYDFMLVLIFLNRLDLKTSLNLSHVLKYLDDFKYLICNIKTYMLSDSIFYPANLKVAKKLAYKEYEFNPYFNYSSLDFYNCNNYSIFQSYTVKHKKFGVIGILLFSDTMNMPILQLHNKKFQTAMFNDIVTHVQHKITKTKILNSVDFKILLNKISLKEFLDKTINIRYTNLINW